MNKKCLNYNCNIQTCKECKMRCQFCELIRRAEK